jgi:Choline/Carnitine o-acyltransferase
LPQTLSKLKSSLQAMAISYEEYEAAVAKIDRFGASGGPGEKLHGKLEKRREYEEREGGRGHWLEEWWDGLGYMGYRDPVSESRRSYAEAE